MTRKLLAVVVAMIPAFGAAYAGQGTTAAAKAPAQKADQKEQKEQKEEGKEAKVQLKNLPAAVRATVEAETKNATIKGLSKETEKGKTVYELESLVNGRTRDLMIDSAGKVYVVEEQLDADKAPPPVRSALEAKGTIVVLESVLENGKTTYEGQVKTKAGKKLSMELDADGKPVKK
jgi:uncharacterized membrane protein YkoI